MTGWMKAMVAILILMIVGIVVLLSRPGREDTVTWPNKDGHWGVDTTSAEFKAEIESRQKQWAADSIDSVWLHLIGQQQHEEDSIRLARQVLAEVKKELDARTELERIFSQSIDTTRWMGSLVLRNSAMTVDTGPRDSIWRVMRDSVVPPKSTPDCTPDSALTAAFPQHWIHRCFCGVYHEAVICPNGTIAHLPKGPFSVVATNPPMYPYVCDCDSTAITSIIDSLWVHQVTVGCDTLTVRRLPLYQYEMPGGKSLPKYFRKPEPPRPLFMQGSW